MIWHSDSTTDILAAFGSTIHSGLSSAQVEWRRRELAEENDRLPRRARFGRTLLRTLIYPATVVAILCCLLAAFWAVYNTARGIPQDPLPALLALGGVGIGVLLRTAITVYAHHTLRQLGKRGAPNVTVLRDGELQTLSANELIPGDVIHIRVGDFVAADCRLLSSEWLVCDETILSGEAHAVKEASAVLSPIVTLPQRRNMIYAGSTVLSGKATAVVVEIGDHTEQRKLSPKSPFTAQPLLHQIRSFAKPLAAVFSLLCVAVTVVALLCGTDVIPTLLNGALLLTLTAGMLPALVTVIWAIGSRHNERRGICLHHESAAESLALADTIVAGKSAFLAPEIPVLVCGYAGEKQFDLRADAAQSEGSKALLRLAALCTEAIAQSPLDRAVLTCAEAHGMPSVLLRETFPSVAALPHDTERQRMLSVHLIGDKKVLLVKGSPAALLPLCREAGAAAEAAAQFGRQGLQVLAVAYRYLDDVPTDLTAEDIVFDLRFAGLLGFSCTVPKRSASLVEACRTADIEPVLITGDSRETAAAVAQKLGLVRSADADALPSCVQAKLTDSRACTAVSALSDNDRTVVLCSRRFAALLKCADVACTTADAAPMLKGAADVVLPDDSFFSLCRAVSLCRGLFGRISAQCRLWYTYLTALLLSTVAALWVVPAQLPAPAMSFLILVACTLPLLLLFGLGSGKRFPQSKKTMPTLRSILPSALLRGAVTTVGCVISAALGQAGGNAAACLFAALGFSFLWQAVGAFLSPAAVRSRHKTWFLLAAALLPGIGILSALLLSPAALWLRLQPISPILLLAAIGISMITALLSALLKYIFHIK